MEKIKDNIYTETDFLGCNPSFVITSSGIVMIDTPQKPLEAFKWRKEIQKYGDVVYIINTDHHQDHALGNYYFNGDIIMHEGTMKMLLSEDRIELCRNWVKLMEPQAEFLMDHYFVKKPTLTYTRKINIYLGEEIFELIHITSHTKVETIVFMPRKKVLFAGDTVCTNGIPGLHESYPKEWLHALKFVEELDFEVLVPGHGKIGNKDSVKQFHRELSMLIKRVEEKGAKGLDRDEVIKEVRYEDTVHLKYPPEFSEFFDNFMDMSIGRLYDELISNSP